jgi:CheY-like chemotaxis protein
MPMDISWDLFRSCYGMMTTASTNAHNRTASRIVMVVDDNDDFRLAVCERLEKMGMKILEAENGEAAALQLKKNHIDLMILDYKMPKMNGLELIEWLQNTQRHVPIIFVSGDINGFVREKVKEAGVFAILEKPCSLSALSLKIQEIFEEDG